MLVEIVCFKQSSSILQIYHVIYAANLKWKIFGVNLSSTIFAALSVLQKLSDDNFVTKKHSGVRGGGVEKPFCVMRCQVATMMAMSRKHKIDCRRFK